MNTESSHSTVPAARNRKRLWLFRLTAVLGGLLLAELVSFLANWCLQTIDPVPNQKYRQERIAKGAPLKGESAETIHPYTGWSFNPQVGHYEELDGRKIPVNELGLLDDGPSIVPRSEDRVIIGISGGSVAWQLSVAGEERLRKHLLADSRFDGREIDIVRLALPGQKQPQQLMTLAWVQSLGAEFDIIVNLDGYNEAVLTVHDNYDAQVNLAYPRAWHARTLDIVEAREFSDAYDLLRIRGTRQKLARSALESPLRWSAIYQLVWRLRNQALETEREQLRARLMSDHLIEGGRGFVAAGPEENFEDMDAAAKAAVELWRRSSLQMHRLVTGSNAVYVHALQPNQYLPGSKPLTEAETQQFYDQGMPEGQTIVKLYPEMIAAGGRLREEGVNFYDLTSVFSDITETLYSDWCCHYNTHGNEILAEHLAAAILDSMEKR